MNKEQLYALRWNATQIARLSGDPKINTLAQSQIEILSQLLGEPVPEEFVFSSRTTTTERCSNARIKYKELSSWRKKALVSRSLDPN